MKKTLLLCIFSSIFIVAFSQDFITKINGEKIKCKVTKVDSINVYLTLKINGEKRNTFINKNEIQSISYGDYQDTIRYKSKQDSIEAYLQFNISYNRFLFINPFLYNQRPSVYEDNNSNGIIWEINQDGVVNVDQKWSNSLSIGCGLGGYNKDRDRGGILELDFSYYKSKYKDFSNTVTRNDYYTILPRDYYTVNYKNPTKKVSSLDLKFTYIFAHYIFGLYGLLGIGGITETYDLTHEYYEYNEWTSSYNKNSQQSDNFTDGGLITNVGIGLNIGYLKYCSFFVEYRKYFDKVYANKYVYDPNIGGNASEPFLKDISDKLFSFGIKLNINSKSW